MYYFTSLIREYGIEDGFEKCMKNIKEYEEILDRCCETSSDSSVRYAQFLYNERNYK